MYYNQYTTYNKMLNKKEGFIKKYMDYRVNGGKYEKISLLGEGGTSQVFLGSLTVEYKKKLSQVA